MDFDDEYTKEVGKEMMLLLQEIVAYCRAAHIGLEVLRRLKSVADSFHETWEREDVKLACQVVEKAIQSPHGKRSKLYQSGIATLKDLSHYKAFKDNKLNIVPQNTIKGFRGGKDYIDGPPPKRPCLEPEGQDGISDDDKYQRLMEDLASTTDTQKMLNIESQVEEMGYEPQIQ